MRKIISCMRKMIYEYEMIRPGDRLAVGVSGGKDSMAMLYGFAELQKYLGIPFKLSAIMLDLQFDGHQTDTKTMQAFCEQKGIPCIVKKTEIGEIVFKRRRETHPCSLCARMRRGALHDAALEAGCNVVALGHHRDDAVETLMMNLFLEGRIGCFSPKAYLSRKKLTMIRPLLLTKEEEITAAVHRNHIPTIQNPCPVDGHTQREWMKEFLANLEKTYPGVRARIFGAMCKGEVSGFKNMKKRVKSKF